MTESESENIKEQEEAVQKLYAFVIREVKNGKDKAAIVQNLIDLGIDKESAPELVNTIYAEIVKKVDAEQFSSESVIPALLGGGLAALVGGIVWGLITTTTGWEIGFVAWGLGWLSGFAVVLFTKGQKGRLPQIIASVSALLGIVVGKYVIFFDYLKEYLVEQHGAEAVEHVSMLSVGAIQLFFVNVVSMLGIYDAIWLFLAIGTAWAIPRSMGIKLTDTMRATAAST